MPLPKFMTLSSNNETKYERSSTKATRPVSVQADDIRRTRERCATAGSARPNVKSNHSPRSRSTLRLNFVNSRSQSRQGSRGSTKVEGVSSSEYDTTSSSSYKTGNSTKGSNGETHDITTDEESRQSKKYQPPHTGPQDFNKMQEIAFKEALNNVTWETMKESEMLRNTAVNSGSRQCNVASPGRVQILVLEEKGYSLVDLIGSGTYANVYKAQYVDPITRQKLDLACKVCDRSIAPPDVVKKFLPREIKILTTLYHPYVIQLHSIIQIQDKLYMFMRFAENGDLLEWIRKYGALKEPHAKIWFRQLVMGLDYLHSNEIVHRDLKCENILLTKKNNLKIADFGFARFCVEDGKRLLSTTFCGSAAYAAPEVVGATPYNPKIADVWSLGVILFIMLNGTMPFSDSDHQKLLSDQLQRKWSFRRSLRKVISSDGKEIVTKMLEPDALHRIYLDKIQRSSFFRMALELKKYKTIKNYSAEILQNLGRLYSDSSPTRKVKEVDDPKDDAFKYQSPRIRNWDCK